MAVRPGHWIARLIALLAIALMVTGCVPTPTAATSDPTPNAMPPPPEVVVASPTAAPDPPPAESAPAALPDPAGQSTLTLAPTDQPPPTPLPFPESSTPLPSPPVAAVIPEQIGLSAGGRPIHAYQLGTGAVAVALVGGVHGGYEWNSILLAERLLAYFQANRAAIPASLTLHIIPNANPDGLFAVTGFDGPFTPADIYADSAPGRFNGNGVDLNRNWDCNWSPVAYWRDQAVPAGAEPFSEPENRALRDYLLAHNPVVVVFIHSAAGAIYVSGCPEPHSPSEELALVYGAASGYPVFPLFDHYTITGDAGDWLTTQGIASFTVELVTHESLDWEQNIAGMSALLRDIGRPATELDWTDLDGIE